MSLVPKMEVFTTVLSISRMRLLSAGALGVSSPRLKHCIFLSRAFCQWPSAALPMPEVVLTQERRSVSSQLGESD